MLRLYPWLARALAVMKIRCVLAPQAGDCRLDNCPLEARDQFAVDGVGLLLGGATGRVIQGEDHE